MELAPIQDEYLYNAVMQLRSEAGGWRGVTKGLDRILIGYFVWIGGLMLGGFAIWVAVDALRGKNTPGGTISSLWVLFAALGFIGLLGMFSYTLILTGKWKCLMSAPERSGAKWLMFGCITCMVIGPALNTAFGALGFEKPPNFEGGAEGLKNFKFKSSALTRQAISGVITVSSQIFFLLFLRSAANCFHNKGRMMLVNVYLVYTGLLIGGTFLLLLGSPRSLLQPEVALGLVGAWVLSFFWYLFLILSIRQCLSEGVDMLDSPVVQPN